MSLYGGHVQDDFVRNRLAQYVDFYPFCPEAAAIGTPRETVRLVDIDHKVRVVGPKSGTDYTDALQSYNNKIIPKFVNKNIDGAIVKSRSPSCGLERIKVYQQNGEWHGHGSKDPMRAGLFTNDLMTALPHLAIEEEGRLTDAWLRENFMLQIFTSARWHDFLQSTPSIADLQVFHRDHKYLFLSKNETLYRQLGELVANTQKANLENSLLNYQQKMFQLLDSKKQ